MVSGFSPSLLNLFCEKGLNAFETCTPWSNLLLMLSDERYQCMGDFLNDELFEGDELIYSTL
jgi:hypothetical protein